MTEVEVIDMFMKIESLNIAKQLEAKGFTYAKETINNKEFYVFKMDKNLAAEIMTNFANERMIVDNTLNF